VGEWFDGPGLDAFRQRAPADGQEVPDLQKPQPGASAASDAATALLDASLRHPASGWVQLHAALRLTGLAVEPADTRRLLRELGLATAHERWLRLEAKLRSAACAPSDEQRAFLAKRNPCWWARTGDNAAPGVLCQQTLCFARCRREWQYTLCRMRKGGWFYVGEVEVPRCIWLHLVVDTGTMAGFALVHHTRPFDAAGALLQDQILSFYETAGVSAPTAITRAGREFCGRSSGCMARFRRILLSEFFRVVAHRRFYESLEGAQSALEHWLRFYNTEREHPGYPNWGRTPLEMMRQSAALPGGDVR
jgi:transposase InsO family protein